MSFGSADVLSSGPGWELSLMQSKNTSSPSQSQTVPRNLGVKPRTIFQKPLFCPSHLPGPCRKGRQLAEWFAARGGKATITVQCTQKRRFCIGSLLHTLQEGEVSWEPAAWGPQLHTLAHSASLSLFNHMIVAHQNYLTFTKEKFSCLWFNRSSIFCRGRLFGLLSFSLSFLRVYLRKSWEILPFHCNPVCTNHVQDLTLLKATAALSVTLLGHDFTLSFLLKEERRAPTPSPTPILSSAPQLPKSTAQEILCCFPFL